MLWKFLSRALLVSVSLLAAAASAQATEVRKTATLEVVEVLGQRLVFSNPKGYCTVGNSPREAALMEISRAGLPPTVRLVHAAASCNELTEYRESRRQYLDHWVQIQLLGSKEGFRRSKASREMFITSLDKASLRMDTGQLENRVNERLSAVSANSLSETQLNSIGRDGNAFYMTVRTTMDTGQTKRKMTGIAGFTLINSVPIAVNVYEATGFPQSRRDLLKVQQELLRSLLIEN